MITNDRTTWPSGDRLWSIAQAIAIAEGYDRPNSNPFHLNNPGDISDGGATFGGEQHSGSRVTHFPDAQTGWQWLYDKLKRISDGKSSVYSAQMTWAEFSQHWAGDWQDWLGNITRDLGVSPESTMEDYLNAQS